MTERLAIKSGMDWYDAEVDFVNVPDGFDIVKAQEDYKLFTIKQRQDARVWYRKYPDWQINKPSEPYPSKLSFADWLIESGRATQSDVIIVWEEMI